MAFARAPHDEPRRLARTGAVLVAALAVACGSDDDRGATSGGNPDGGTPSACPPGIEGPACGLFPDGCGPAEAPLAGGGCAAVVPDPTTCAPGFSRDTERGCRPILPADTCGPGAMAVPGHGECRPPTPCGDGPYGDEPLPPDTLYVDPRSPSAGDGTVAAPFSTLSAALAAARARPGSTIAVADGRHPGPVRLDFDVRLRGRCAQRVTIEGAATPGPSSAVSVAGRGTREIAGIAVTGPWAGIAAAGVDALRITGVRVHDTGIWGIDVSAGSSGVTIDNTVVESAGEVGVFAYGSEVTLDGVQVRDTRPAGDGRLGRGIDAEPEGGATPRVTVLRSAIDGSHDAGVYGIGAQIAVDGSVVRDTRPEAISGTGGQGIYVIPSSAAAPSTLTVTRSWLEGNHDTSLHVAGSEGVVDDTVVIGTLPDDRGDFGIGVGAWVSTTTGGSASLALRRCVVTGSRFVGAYALGSSLTLEGSVVERTASRTTDGTLGMGVIAQDLPGGPSSNLTVSRTIVRENRSVGVLANGSSAILRDVVVRDTTPEETTGEFGIGVALHVSPEGRPSEGDLDGVLVQRARDVGIDLNGARATLARVRVEGVLPRLSDGSFGDGIYVGATMNPSGRDPVVADVTISSSAVGESARAGVAVFGAALTLADAVLACNAFDLDVERHYAWDAAGERLERDFALTDGAGNVCGCAGSAPCQAQSSGLLPAGDRPGP